MQEKTELEPFYLSFILSFLSPKGRKETHQNLMGDFEIEHQDTRESAHKTF